MTKRLSRFLQELLTWTSSPLLAQECCGWSLRPKEYWPHLLRPWVEALRLWPRLQRNTESFAETDWSFLTRSPGSPTEGPAFYRLIRLWVRYADRAESRYKEGEPEDPLAALAISRQFFKDCERLGQSLKPCSDHDLYRAFSPWGASSRKRRVLLDAYLTHSYLPLVILSIATLLPVIDEEEQTALQSLYQKVVSGHWEMSVGARQAFFDFWGEYLLNYEHKDLPKLLEKWLGSRAGEDVRLPYQDTRLRAAQMLLRRGRYTEALGYVDTLTGEKTVSGPEQVLFGIRVARQATAWRECLSLCDRALSLGLNNQEIYTDQAFAFYNKQDYHSSARVALRGISQCGEGVQLRIALGYAQLQMGKPKLALQSFHKAATLHPEGKGQSRFTDLHLGLARSYHALGEDYAALREYKRILRPTKETLNLRREYIELLYHMGYLREALQVADDGLAIEPDYPPLLFVRVAVLVGDPRLGTEEELLTAINKAGALFSDTPEILNQLAIAAYTVGMDAVSLDYTLRALRLNPDMMPAWDMLCELLESRGLFREALAATELMLRQNPHDVDTLLTRAELFTQLGEWQKALEAYDSCQQLEGLRPEIARGKMQIYEFLGLSEEAKTWENIARLLTDPESGEQGPEENGHEDEEF